ncbi:MAG: LPS-assembly protein LptD, partial [Paracoccaceae bacterium]
VLDAAYDFRSAWTANINTRYDLIADRATRAGIGLNFRNECVNLDLSVARRYTSSTSVQATTDFGFSVEFLGIGGNAKGTARQCRR